MKQISQKIKDNQYQKFLAYILNSNKLLRKSILVLFDCASIIISLFISNLLIFDSIQLINKNLNLTIFFNAFLIALTL